MRLDKNHYIILNKFKTLCELISLPTRYTNKVNIPIICIKEYLQNHGT